jgi:hypothetical protein
MRARLTAFDQRIGRSLVAKIAPGDIRVSN